MTLHIFSIPLELWLFALTLAGIAIFHRFALSIALAGVGGIALYKVLVTGFKTGSGLAGFAGHMAHEWMLLSNLFLLLTGFAVLARHVEDSHLPLVMPHYLPDDWKGGLTLLAFIFVLSAFLDNIAAALIGGTVARTVFRNRVHLGFLAAIAAASNAGGSGSVIGDTTTTMIWIAGKSPLEVLHAYVAAVVAFLVFAVFAARQQHTYQPILKDWPRDHRIAGRSIAAVALILGAAVAANVVVNLYYPQTLDHVPVVGLAVWAAILATSPLHKPDLSVVGEAAKGSVFLLSLVAAASMMPIETLPPASADTVLLLGFVSAIFDNIPLTALALNQGGYDWGMLAYAVGFGGSMIWFGSSAGVALSNLFPEAKSAVAWLGAAWYIPVAYVAGYFALLITLGWSPA